MIRDFRKVNMKAYRDAAPAGSVEWYLRHLEFISVGNLDSVRATTVRYTVRQIRKAMEREREVQVADSGDETVRIDPSRTPNTGAKP